MTPPPEHATGDAQVRCDQVPVVLSQSSRWAGQDHAAAAIVPLRKLLHNNRHLSVCDVLRYALRALQLQQPEEAVACTFVVAAGTTKRTSGVAEDVGGVAPRRCLTRRNVLVSPSANADPVLGYLTQQTAAHGDAEVVVELIVLSDWEEMKRNDPICSLPSFTANGGGGSVALLSTGRVPTASRDALDGAAGCTPRRALLAGNPTSSTCRKRDRLELEASPCIDIPAALDVEGGAPPPRAPGGRPLPTDSPRPPTRTSLLEHPPAAAPPVADLATLNMWIQKHKLASWHVVPSLLCPVCGLMPVKPVVVPCCCSTQCATCAASGKPSAASRNQGTEGASGRADQDKNTQQLTSTDASDATVTCTHCGEERLADADLLPNAERAAAVARWAKEMCVMYRDELTERAQGVLSAAPPRVLFPYPPQHQQPHSTSMYHGSMSHMGMGLPPPPPHLMMPPLTHGAMPPPPPQYGSPHSPHSPASFHMASPTTPRGYR